MSREEERVEIVLSTALRSPDGFTLDVLIESLSDAGFHATPTTTSWAIYLFRQTYGKESLIWDGTRRSYRLAADVSDERAWLLSLARAVVGRLRNLQRYTDTGRRRFGHEPTVVDAFDRVEQSVRWAADDAERLARVITELGQE